MVIRGVTLLTGEADDTLDTVGDLLAVDGKIGAVGAPGLPVPAGTVEVDGTGKYLTPGLVDMHNHMGVYPWLGDWAANDDGNEHIAPVTNFVRAMDSLNPQDPAANRLLGAGGVTTALILPGSANVMGGEGVAVKLHGRTVADMRLADGRRALKMACGALSRAAINFVVLCLCESGLGWWREGEGMRCADG